MAPRTQSHFSLFIIDIDNFKDYNDGYGHLAGDKIITLQASMLKDIFSRETDVVARYGGEEFVAACLTSGSEDADYLAKRIIDNWAYQKAPHGKGKGNSYVSSSVGYITTKAENVSSIESLLSKADKALYKAKAEGRNRSVKHAY